MKVGDQSSGGQGGSYVFKDGKRVCVDAGTQDKVEEELEDGTVLVQPAATPSEDIERLEWADIDDDS